MAFLVTSREASGAAAFVAWISEQRTTRDMLATSRRDGDGAYYRPSVTTKQACPRLSDQFTNLIGENGLDDFASIRRALSQSFGQMRRLTRGGLRRHRRLVRIHHSFDHDWSRSGEGAVERGG